jgi:hypothetical protein
MTHSSLFSTDKCHLKEREPLPPPLSLLKEEKKPDKNLLEVGDKKCNYLRTRTSQSQRSKPTQQSFPTTFPFPLLLGDVMLAFHNQVSKLALQRYHLPTCMDLPISRLQISGHLSQILQRPQRSPIPQVFSRPKFLPQFCSIHLWISEHGLFQFAKGSPDGSDATECFVNRF